MIYDYNMDINEHVNPALHVQMRSQDSKNGFDPNDFLKSQALESFKNRNNDFKVSSLIDIDKFSQKLVSISRGTTAHQCAKYVRIALESAGANFSSHPIAASDWGATLMQIGYKRIEPSFENPQEGDIYIIKSTNRHRYGHIAGFTGSQWVSDFRQRSHDVYRDNSVTYQYYRL